MQMNLALFIPLSACSAATQVVHTSMLLAFCIPQATCTVLIQDRANFGSLAGQEERSGLFLLSRRDKMPWQFIFQDRTAPDCMAFSGRITGTGVLEEGQWGQSIIAVESFRTVQGPAFHWLAEDAFEPHFCVGDRTQEMSLA